MRKEGKSIMNLQEIDFTDIGALKVGHAECEQGVTGCTVVICQEEAVAGVDVRGGAPGTRETDLLASGNLVDKVHAVFLAGGSAYGLNAAAGIMSYLEERDIGFDVGVGRVPIVPGAVLFDLAIGDPQIRPDAEMGYRACENATSASSLSGNISGNVSGNIGAGMGATVGKFAGPAHAMKSGLGSCGLQAGEIKVGALVAVNCLGDVVDEESNRILAGAVDKDSGRFLNTEAVMLENMTRGDNLFGGNTTIGIVATNAVLTKPQANKVSSMAHNGYARAIRPSHTMVDGDAIFTVSSGEIAADLNTIGFIAAEAMRRAILQAVLKAKTYKGYIAASELC